jgi:hypothetical protein
MFLVVKKISTFADGCGYIIAGAVRSIGSVAFFVVEKVVAWIKLRL